METLNITPKYYIRGDTLGFNYYNIFKLIFTKMKGFKGLLMEMKVSIIKILLKYC